MSASLGRPVADLDDFLDHAPEPALRTAPEPAPAAIQRRSGGGRWIMAAAALLVVGGVGYWWLDTDADSPEPDTIPAVTTGVSSGVGGFAEMYVAAYLTDAAGAVGEFLPAAPSTQAMTPAARYVTRTAAMEVNPAGVGYWSVVVAADVLALASDGYHPVGLQYFLVGVVDDGGRLVAAALPARVAGPAARSGPPRSLQVAEDTATGAQAALVGDFLEAMLVGGRDITRYVSAASGLSAIAPAPYAAISVTAIGTFSDGSLVATVDAREEGGTISTMQYVLRLAVDGADLVVAELLAGPPVIFTGTEGGS